MELFIPEQLMESRKRIEASRKDAREAYSLSREDVRAVAERVYSAPKQLRSALGKALSEADIARLAGYIPYNYLEEDESDLCDILQVRLTPQAARILYQQWQNALSNAQCLKLIKKLTVSNLTFQNMLQDVHLEQAQFMKILNSPSIPLAYDYLFTQQHFSGGDELEHKMQYYGVVPGSQLDLECKRALLAYCGRADYLSCSEDNLLGIIQTYDSYLFREFLQNFLQKMSLAELQAYPRLAAYLRGVTGNKRSESFKEYFAGYELKLVEKFLDWINLLKINTYFENDERSRFWKQYRYLNVIRYPKCNTVVLEFSKYVAVEFLGPKKGTIYLCEKEKFRESFYQQFSLLNQEELQQYFKSHRDQCAEYRNHSGRWQSHIASAIEKRQITEKIKI